MTEQTITHTDLYGEAIALRGQLRAAADEGDVAEVTRLLQRSRELEDLLFAREYVNVRHGRKVNRQAYSGYNPSLERVEARLSERLARLGVPSHR